MPYVNGDVVLPWVISAAPLRDAQPVREYSFEQVGRLPGRIYVSTRAGFAASGER